MSDAEKLEAMSKLVSTMREELRQLLKDMDSDPYAAGTVRALLTISHERQIQILNGEA